MSVYHDIDMLICNIGHIGYISEQISAKTPISEVATKEGGMMMSALTYCGMAARRTNRIAEGGCRLSGTR